MMKNQNDLRDSLQQLGLTENEAKTIIGMVKIGTKSDATTISKVSDVPRSKIYSTLKKLNEQGLISIIPIEGGTNYYEPLKINIIIDILKAIKEESLKNASFMAEEQLKKLQGSLSITTGEKLDFVAIKGRERIIAQITDLLDQFHDPTIRIIINMPIQTYKIIVSAVLEKLIEIEKNSSHPMNLDLLVNAEELKEIKSVYGQNILKGHFLAVQFPTKDNKSVQNAIKLPITAPSGNIGINLLNLFESRPFFMIVGTESAFIVIENDYSSTALRIQNKTFLQFQQDILNSLFAVIKLFGKDNFLVN